MASQFADWKAHLGTFGAGGSSAELRPLRKGAAYAVNVGLATHATFGDWTDGTFTMQAKASPGIDAPSLADFAISVGTPAGGVTTVTITLAVAAQTNLPDPGDSHVGELVYDLLYTPGSGGDNLVMGGTIPLIEGVTG